MKKMASLLLILITCCSQETSINKNKKSADFLQRKNIYGEISEYLSEEIKENITKKNLEIAEIEGSLEKYFIELSDLNQQYQDLIDQNQRIERKINGEEAEFEVPPIDSKNIQLKNELLITVNNLNSSTTIINNEKESLITQIKNLEDQLSYLSESNKSLTAELIKSKEIEIQVKEEKIRLLEIQKIKINSELEKNHAIEENYLITRRKNRENEEKYILSLINQLQKEKENAIKELNKQIPFKTITEQQALDQIKNELKNIESQRQAIEKDRVNEENQRKIIHKEIKDKTDNIYYETLKNHEIRRWEIKHEDFLKNIREKSFLLDNTIGLVGGLYIKKNDGSIQYCLWDPKNRLIKVDEFGNFEIAKNSGKIYFTFLRSEQNDWGTKYLKGIYNVTSDKPRSFIENHPYLETGNLKSLVTVYIDPHGVSKNKAKMIFYSSGGIINHRFAHQQ
ncbi:MAG: hypothetical protein ACRCTJ_00270 [Brevinema sp.]